MTGLSTGVLLALALLLWPTRTRDRVARGLADLPRRRTEAERQRATTGQVRGLLAADPVAGAGRGAEQVVERLQHRLGRSRISDDDVLHLLDGLTAALSAGLPPHAALQLVVDAGGELPWVAPVLRAGARGAPLGPVWCRVAEESGNATLRHVASAWSLSERSGAALAPAVATAAETVRASRESRQSARSAASGAMASMYMLSLLPVVGVAGAALLGWSPRELYLEQPLGLVSAGLGVVLLVVGWLVSRRIVAGALRGKAIR
ncbi:type II secretion system F family protein [Kytococcus sp. Marseille-QA3725]